MANRCAGLDPTWAHLPTPTPSHTAHAAASHYYYSSPAWLTPAAAFENEALTSALRASMSPAHAAASSYPTTPSSSSTSSASELLSGGHDAPAPGSRSGPPALARPKTGRVAKRKPRPSRRAQATYITADPANFRRMVQEITGFPVSSAAAASELASSSAAPTWLAPPRFVLPTLDTSAFLLDRALTVPAPEEKSSSGGGASAVVAAAATAEPAVDEPSSVLHDLEEAMACAPAFASGFPTLESWGII